MVEVINVTSMDAVATEDIHSVSNNDLKLVETRTQHFAWLKSSSRFDRINKLVCDYSYCQISSLVSPLKYHVTLPPKVGVQRWWVSWIRSIGEGVFTCSFYFLPIILRSRCALVLITPTPSRVPRLSPASVSPCSQLVKACGRSHFKWKVLTEPQLLTGFFFQRSSNGSLIIRQDELAGSGLSTSFSATVGNFSYFEQLFAFWTIPSFLWILIYRKIF